MDYDCTKPLGNQLENYLDTDLEKICFELSLHGIVYEHQWFGCQNLTPISILF